MPYRITSLFYYPVKSLGGIAAKSAMAGERGFQHDRRWMIVDESDNPITQRERPQMSLLRVKLLAGGIEIFDRQRPSDRIFAADGDVREIIQTTIWGDSCRAERFTSPELSSWLSEKVGQKCGLAYAPEDMTRLVDQRYSPIEVNTAFSDGFPYLLANTASLAELNRRAGQDFEMERFRPNIVVEGDAPFQEDQWKKIRIGSVVFHLAKPCARCVITTIDPSTGKKGAEPLKTLATFRRQENRLLFAQNMVAENTGEIKVGDWLEVLETR